jgi:hypothetical protein
MIFRQGFADVERRPIHVLDIGRRTASNLVGWLR